MWQFWHNKQVPKSSLTWKTEDFLIWTWRRRSHPHSKGLNIGLDRDRAQTLDRPGHAVKGSNKPEYLQNWPTASHTFIISTFEQLHEEIIKCCFIWADRGDCEVCVSVCFVWIGPGFTQIRALNRTKRQRFYSTLFKYQRVKLTLYRKFSNIGMVTDSGRSQIKALC